MKIKIEPTPEQRSVLVTALQMRSLFRLGAYVESMLSNGTREAFEKAVWAGSDNATHRDPDSRCAFVESSLKAIKELTKIEEYGIPGHVEKSANAGMELAGRIEGGLTVLSDGVNDGAWSSQVGQVIEALDFWSWIGMGQFEEILWIVRHAHMFNHPEYDARAFEQIASLVTGVKQVVWGFPSGASYSIRSESVPEKFRIAYDMQQVLRKHVHDEKNRLKVASGKALDTMDRISVWGDDFHATADHPKLQAEVLHE